MAPSAAYFAELGQYWSSVQLRSAIAYHHMDYWGYANVGDVSDPTDEERAAYGKPMDAHGDLVNPLGRNPTELVRAYEAGEDRTKLLREMGYVNSLCRKLRGCDYSMALALERRLFLSRTGGPLEVKAYLGESLKLREVAYWFGGVEPEDNGEDYSYYLALLLFDEEAVLMRAHHDFGMPEDRRWCSADLIFFSRSEEFELNARDAHASPPPLEPTRRAVLEGWETDGNLLRISSACRDMESIFCDALEQLLEGRRLVAWSGFAYKDEIVPHDEIVPLLPYFRGDFEGGSWIAFAKVVKRMYRIMPDEEFQEVPIALADLPPPGELRRRSRNWQVRGPHVVLRSLLEKRRAGLGRGALLTYHYLHGKMPAAMFRVILSFL